ncbi:hypothetical protein [Gayadomonas joobiniege]|uniref:hypothetical protein n=1 Tax=Gayadomonas joobiniege TaxID=1234606 RepID=UPI0003668A3D|nr:hypothetical protein [Gayadomonas joobiniege]
MNTQQCDIRELTLTELNEVCGGDAYEASRIGLAAYQTGTGMLFGNPLRVATGAFALGYYGATALGADDLGRAIGSWLYDTFN